MQYKSATRAVERFSQDEGRLDQIEVCGDVQSILVAAANISKILWPSKNVSKERGEAKTSTGIENNNQLHSCKFRNHFEHYGERVQEWFIKNRQV